MAGLLLFFSPGQSGLQAAGNSPTNESPPTVTDAAYAPGEVLVGVHQDTVPFSKEKGTEAMAVTDLPVFAGMALIGVDVLTITDVANAPLFLRLRVVEGSEIAAIAQLQSDPSIVFAEPNWVAHAAGTSIDEMPTPVLPSDPLFRTSQWGMQRVGAPRAWAISQGAPIRVAVVDSGIDFSHPEFAGRILPGKNYVTTGTTPQDDSGHGTHISGIIGAALNNQVGVAGLAPQAMIDPRKVLDSRNEGLASNIAQAIRDAADDGAKIINLSLTLNENSSVLEAAVNYALGKGVLLIGAAGNSAPNPVWWPAAYAGVLAVAATNRSDQRTYYSHTGAVDLAAPGGLSGQLIYSTWPTGIKCSTPAPTGYCTAFGTSMSAAYVSGVAALAWGTRPALTLVQIKNLLLESAYRTGAPSTDLGAGRVDAQKTVRQVLLSDLRLSQAQIDGLIPIAAPPFTTTVALNNPSGEPIYWQAEVTAGKEWLTVGQTRASNSLRYGEPAQLSATISPTQLAVGDHLGSVRVTGSRLSGSSVVLNLPVQLGVREEVSSLYLSQTARTSPLFWQAPNAVGKQPLQLTDSSSTGLLLPFTVTLESQAVTSVRVYADGFLTFPASDSPTSLPINCTPETTSAQQAIYGWWSDLNPAEGGSVSTFTSTTGAFVTEYFDVPLASSPAQRVSFQIALFPNGRVNLNYADVPTTSGDVAVGMEINEGLLSTAIACRKGATVLGILPTSGQTITIETSDLR